MRGALANGEQIQAARRSRGLTQEQLAKLVGLDAKTIRSAEQGRRLDFGTITRISFALDLDISGLIAIQRSPHELEVRRRDVVLRWNDAFEARDTQALLTLYHEDAVLHLPGAPVIPGAGDHRGKEAICRAHEIVWNTYLIEPLLQGDFSLLVSHNAVVLTGRKGVHLLDGRVEKTTFVHIFTFLDQSDLVVDHRVEYDTLFFARLVQTQQPALLAREV